MARDARKALGNAWYDARMKAAKTNEKLGSRFGAAEEAGMSEDSIKRTELGLEKSMPVDKAVILADLYHAPELLNYYCLHECPIGCDDYISDEVVTVDRAAVKLIDELSDEKIARIKKLILGVARDGELTEDDLDDIGEVRAFLDRLSVMASEVRTLIDRS